MSIQYNGNYSTDLFNAAKRYKIKFSKNSQISDSELSEISQISDSFIRQLISANFPTGSSINNGFKVVQSSSELSNNFTIKGGDGTINGAGVLFVDGYILFLKSDIEYNAQNSYGNLTNDNYTKTTIPTLTIPSGNRTDEVYVDFYFAEVSATSGSEYLDSNLIITGIGTKTANRLRMVQDIRVAEGGTTPISGNDSNGIYHWYVKIATINRVATTNITSAMITDNRILVNSNHSYMNGTANSIKLIDGASIGDSTHRISSIYMASNIDYTTNDLLFKNNGTEKIRFTTDGKIGIGTTPLVNLHVIGSANISGNFTLSSLTSSKVLIGDLNKNIVSSSITETELNFLSGKNSIIDGIGTTGYVAYFSNSSRLANSSIFESSGNVGIGITTGLTAKLQVQGSAVISNNLTVNGTTNLSTITASRPLVTDSSKNVIASNVTVTELNYLSGKNSVIDGSGTINYIPYFSSSNRLTNSSIYQDQTTGNVGIGISNPLYKLHINGISGIYNNGAYFQGWGNIYSNMSASTSSNVSANAWADGANWIALTTGTSAILSINSTGDLLLYKNSLVSAGNVITLTSPLTVWHSGNDGTNSGLDADFLDGKHASDFVLASSNINADTLDGKHASDFVLVGTPIGNADTLDGKHASDFALAASTVNGSGTTNYIPYFSNSNTLSDSSICQVLGNIGIGITNPTHKLQISGVSGVYNDGACFQGWANSYCNISAPVSSNISANVWVDGGNWTAIATGISAILSINNTGDLYYYKNDVIAGNTVVLTSPVFRVAPTGQVYSDAGTTISSPADLAEWTKVQGDNQIYEIGTIVQQSDEDFKVSLATNSECIYGIVTDRATFCGGLTEGFKDEIIKKDFMSLKNEEVEDKYNAKKIAMTGHVQCKVIGKIIRGQRITLSHIPGVGKAAITLEEKLFAFALARENYNSEVVGLIEVRLSGI